MHERFLLFRGLEQLCKEVALRPQLDAVSVCGIASIPERISVVVFLTSTLVSGTWSTNANAYSRQDKVFGASFIEYIQPLACVEM